MKDYNNHTHHSTTEDRSTRAGMNHIANGGLAGRAPVKSGTELLVLFI